MWPAPFLESHSTVKALRSTVAENPGELWFNAFETYYIKELFLVYNLVTPFNIPGCEVSTEQLQQSCPVQSHQELSDKVIALQLTTGQRKQEWRSERQNPKRQVSEHSWESS